MTERPSEATDASTDSEQPNSSKERVELTSLRVQPLKEQVLDQLRALIDDGVLKPGDRLPGERELSEQLQVSRGTVREALHFLGALGVVDIRHGQGTFVRATLTSPVLHDEWREWTLLNSGQISSLLEVRVGLESFAAELAATRSDRSDLEVLRSSLRDMKRAIRSSDITALVQSDVNFHHGLCLATGNTVLVDLADALGKRLLRERAAAWDIPGRPELSLSEHSAIFEAVRAGDVAGSRAAVSADLTSVERDLARLAEQRKE